MADAKQGMATSDNERFLRYWTEVSHKNIKFGCRTHNESQVSHQKWYPYNKGEPSDVGMEIMNMWSIGKMMGKNLKISLKN